MGNQQVLKTTTNRSVYNKANLFNQDVWSRRERNRRKRDYYYKQSYDKNEYYGFNLIHQEEVDRSTALSYINQLNYGIEWEWRTRYKYTIVRNRVPSWKLTSKCKRQYQRKKLIKDDTMSIRQMTMYNELIAYLW